MTGSSRTTATKNGKSLSTQPADQPQSESTGVPASDSGSDSNSGTPWDQKLAADPDGKHWDSWRLHLNSREQVASLLSQAKRAEDSPLLWGLPESSIDGGTRHLVETLARFLRKLDVSQPNKEKSSKRKTADPRGPAKAHVKEVLSVLEEWLEEDVAEVPGPSQTIATLAWSHAISGLTNILEPGVWFQLLDRLESVAEEARTLGGYDDSWSAPPHAVWARQVLAGEVPWTLARQLPELSRCQRMGSPSRGLLSQTLVELTDGEGLLHARFLSVLRPLLACWTRCQQTPRENGKSPLKKHATEQYEWLVRQSLRLSRPDGTPMFAKDHQKWNATFLREALECDGDHDDLKVAEHLFLKPDNKNHRSKRGHGGRFAPAVHSNWAGVTLLRPALHGKSPWTTLAYDNTDMQIELGVGKHLLLDGPLQTEVSIDGEPVEWDGEFEELCWFSDNDVDYIELELQGTGCRLQRQVLLAREDEFLLFADAILTERTSELGYQLFLPLAEDVRFEPEVETREGQLVRRAPLANVLPLALPEWQCQPHPGRLRELRQEDESRLELGQLMRGRRLYAPLFIDLKPGRVRKARTWRQLTVGENLTIQPPDVACGYRVQAGKKQWVVYRSLAPSRNRTILGENLTDEFLCARFDSEGDMEPLVKIESDET